MHLYYLHRLLTSVADSWFNRGERQLLRGPPTYYLSNFPPKPHENEEILVGGRRHGRASDLMSNSNKIKYHKVVS